MTTVITPLTQAPVLHIKPRETYEDRQFGVYVKITSVDFDFDDDTSDEEKEEALSQVLNQTLFIDLSYDEDLYIDESFFVTHEDDISDEITQLTGWCVKDYKYVFVHPKEAHPEFWPY